MNKFFKLIKKPLFYLPKYQSSSNFLLKKSDLSNDLLISLSMGFQNKQPTNHQELVLDLTQSSSLYSQQVTEVFSQLDRAMFVSSNKNNTQKLYQNTPLDIGSGQNMTSPYMQAIVLEKINEQIQQTIKEKSEQVNVLDVGFGSGFIGFAIGKIFQQSDSEINVKIKGIDIYESLYEKALSIQKKLDFKKQIEFEFLTVNVEEILQNANEKFDIINIGFAISQELYDSIKQTLLSRNNQNNCLICPVIGEDLEQKLLFFNTKKGEIEIMKCVYSQMTTLKQQEANKYFLTEEEFAEDNIQQEAEQVDKQDCEQIQLYEKIIFAEEEKFRKLCQRIKEEKKEQFSIGLLNQNEEVQKALLQIKLCKRKLKKLQR